MKSLRETLVNWIDIIDNADNGEKYVNQDMLQYLYDINKENTLTLFLNIQELERKEQKQELQTMYMGLESSMHNFSNLSRRLLEDKTSRQAKASAEEYIESGNLAYLIYICKAYFADGEYNGASNSGKWVLDSFINILRNNKAKYIEGGDSYDWAKNHGHEDYINLIIQKYNL